MSTIKTESTPPEKELRIASLLPAATDVCVALGLPLVGVTHECDVYDDTLRLTACGLLPDSTQGDIHAQVQQSIGSSSLYPILTEPWKEANPNLVLTQDLCAVCGPSSDSVCAMGNKAIKTLSMSPTSLAEVGETIVSIATACNVKEQGEALEQQFWSQLKAIQTLVSSAAADRPKVLMLEWLDPPFDGGHWIPEMMDYAGVAYEPKKEAKSKVLSWQDVENMKPDVVLVACCGFDLARNSKDATTLYRSKLLQHLPPTCRIYAADGNQYFARPGPKLSGGVAILAMAAYEHDDDNKKLYTALEALDFAPKRGEGWDRVDLQRDTTMILPDVEDLASAADCFSKLHDEACRRGDHQYKDPATGYNVFTQVAHKARGKCCGSGCRHCPYNHENVKDKASRIQQPAFLYKATTMTDVSATVPIKVLFFSGGKDSFLTIRALMRQSTRPHVVLLTTFDVTSRIVANQDIAIQTIARQATHLDLSLLGIPRHRASGLDYTDQIRQGLDLVERTYARRVDALVFGDLHLQHIRSWRNDRLGTVLGYPLEYPLWHVPYDKLMEDLEHSQVPCVVSASTVDTVSVGTKFTRAFSDSLAAVDAFGENGEFHSCAQVWETDRIMALGIK